MWGGPKFAAKSHVALFKEWSGPSEEVRRKLIREPRPWYLFLGLHRAYHKIDDVEGAKFLTWSTSVFQLEQRPDAKIEAYQLSQEVFRTLHISHHVKHRTIEAMFRLCYAGKDLTSAYEWYNHLSKDPLITDQDCIRRMAWLLRIASVVPEDHVAESMACAVKELYVTKYCTIQDGVETEVQHNLQPRQLEELFACFRNLESRISANCEEDPALAAWISALPASPLAGGWKPELETSEHKSPCVFPQLEAMILQARCSDLAAPTLIDSILNPDYIKALEAAAFSHDLPRTTKLIQRYQSCIASEVAEKSVIGKSVWRNPFNFTAKNFRFSIMGNETGSITAEIYHYLIVALSRTSTKLALETLKKVEQSNLRILDLTRAVMIWRLAESPEEQAVLFQQQMEAVRFRAQLDADRDITKAVLAYWAFDYTELLYYRNALGMTKFLLLLMNKMGVSSVFDLALRCKLCADHVLTEDLVSVNAPLRIAAAKHWWARNGPVQVADAIDEICNTSPHLDVALVAALKPFEDYTLQDGDEIATDPTMLQRTVLAGYDQVFLLDASFIESSESFECVASSTAIGLGNAKSLMLVTYSTLLDLYFGAKAASSPIPESFDRAHVTTRPHIVMVLERRLVQLASLVKMGRLRILHFTETLLSHGISGFPVSIRTTNDEMLAVSVLLDCVMRSDVEHPHPQDRRVFLCTEDPALEKLTRDISASTSSWGRGISIVSSPEQSTESQQAKEASNSQSPLDVIGISDTFEPVPNRPLAFDASSELMDESSQASQQTSDESHVESPWLRMLDEENNEPTSSLNVSAPAACASQVDETSLTLLQSSPLPATTGPQDPTAKIAQAISSYLPNCGELLNNLSDLQRQNHCGISETFGNRERLSKPVPRRSPLEELDAKKNKYAQHRTPLYREEKANLGLNRRQRVSLARHVSNVVDGRIPFNFRFNVYEANALDPRNKHLVKSFQRGLSARVAGKASRVGPTGGE